MQSVSQSGSIASVRQRPEFVPHIVRTLDTLINNHITRAHPGAEQDAWLRIKADVKRRLIDVPPDCLEGEARNAIDAITRQVIHAA